jgi:hypothetical protein
LDFEVARVRSTLHDEHRRSGNFQEDLKRDFLNVTIKSA